MEPESNDDYVKINQIVNVKHVKTVLLNNRNYYAWRAQFAAILKGNHLMHFVKGNVELNDPINEQHDQLILGCLLSVISLTILSTITVVRLREISGKRFEEFMHLREDREYWTSVKSYNLTKVPRL